MGSLFGITPAEMNSSAAGSQAAAPAPIAPIQPGTQGNQTAPSAIPASSPFGISPTVFASAPDNGAQGAQAPKSDDGSLMAVVKAPVTEVTDTFDAFKSGMKKAYDGFQQTREAVQSKDTFAGIEGLGRGILNEAGGLIEAGLSPITGTLKTLSRQPLISQSVDLVKKWVIDPAADKISNISALQDFMKTNPHADEIVGNLITIGGALLGGKNAGEIKTATSDAISTAADTYAGLKAKATAEAKPAAPDATPTGFAPEVVKEQVQKVADQWTKPAQENLPSYKNARAALEKNPDTPTFLAEQRIDPYSHIEDGKYNTESTAQELRDTAGKITSDSLRPALHAADYTTPKMPVADIKPVIDTTGHLVTADDAEAINSLVTKKLDALQRKYPDGMNLVQQLDEKIIYDKNGGYKEYKPAADNNSAIANRAIADQLRVSLDKNAPEGVPVKEVNAYSSKFYKAAEYLDALNGKKAPTTFLQDAVRYGAKVLGAKAGSVLGGDLVSSFVGYHVGKALETALENMTNPMRDAFLRQMKVVNPEAYTKLEAYFGKEATRAATVLKLNPGQPLGSTGNPIIPPAPTTFEPAAPKGTRVSYNPKTGDTYETNIATGKKRIIPKKK